MPAIANVSINNYAAVSHTFNPVSIDSVGVARLVDKVGGIAVGFPGISQALRGPTKDSRNYKLTVKVAVPTLEVTAPQSGSGFVPAPTKAYDVSAVVEIILPERSTLAERRDLLAYLKNYLAHANVTAAVESFETIY